MRIPAATCVLALILAAQVAEANWPQFRGTHHNNVSNDAGLPSEWGDDQNVTWKTKIPGRGWASPIVWGDKVFVATAVKDPSASGDNNQDIDHRWELHCLDRETGKTVWSQLAHEGKPSIPTHGGNTYASETPVTDGERVYVYFGMMGLYCYDFDGNLVWKKDLGVYPMQNGWGTSSAPVLHNGLVLLQVDNERESFLVALNTETGDEVWRVDRDEKTTWSTPAIWANSARTELVTAGLVTRSYDPASGELLWSLDLGGGRCCSSPVADGDRLFVGSEPRDSGGTLFAVKAGATGDITPTSGATSSDGVLWSLEGAGPRMSSPLAYQGYIYIPDRRSGRVSCINAETGEVAYENKLLPGSNAHWASPWAYDDQVFILDDTGNTHVLKPGPEFEVLRTNSIRDKFWSTLAIADGSLFLRSVDYVYCVTER